MTNLPLFAIVSISCMQVVDSLLYSDIMISLRINLQKARPACEQGKIPLKGKIPNAIHPRRMPELQGG